MPLHVEPLTGTAGGVVEGIDLAAPIGPELVADLLSELADRGVLFFPGQDLDDAGHVRVASTLGRVEAPAAGRPVVDGHPEIVVISTANGYADNTHRWHSDSSWEANPQRFCLLRMVEPTSVGGDTLWSNQCAAFAGLSAPTQRYVEPLTAHHELFGRGADHPLVVRHPLSGRKSLYVNEFFTASINELTPRESDALVRMLVAHSESPEFTCRWRWSDRDVVLWDNHFVNHYAVGDYAAQPREIRRIDIQREPPSAAAPTLETEVA
jgi:taurine dioxygenase